MAAKIGPFEIQNLLGRGGMAEVWQGLHTGLQTPVAIKILHSAHADSPSFFRAFREEVRALAGLEHEAIIQIYDFGLLSEELRIDDYHSFQKGTPYLVMERAYDTLLPYCGRLSWNVLFPISVRLLQGLAHAHARGVIHRDIKPENILAFQHLYDIKLTDFGIAHSMESKDSEENKAALHGTPPYMAPEQFSGNWRNYGPWTDLYALGCTIFSLLTGQPPLGTQITWMEAMARHIVGETIQLPLDIEAPPGFEDWLRKMMAKRPVDRFQRAADACQALIKLQSNYNPDLLDHTMTLSGFTLDEIHEELGAEFGEALTMNQNLDAPTSYQGALQAAHMIAWNPRELSDTEEHQTAFNFSSEQLVPAIATLLDEPLPFPEEIPPVPAFQNSADLHEVGLGLVGLRAIPLVGRDQERLVLWNALRQVSQEQKARWVLLQGDSGYGKSRLARWLSETAHELGLATILHARHNPSSNPFEGLRTMLARHLQCLDLDRNAIVDRLKRMFEARGLHQEERWLALAELISPLPSPRDTREIHLRRVYFSNPGERYEATLHFLQMLAEERPVILLFDDLQWSFDSLQFIDHCLRSKRSSSLPLLLVSTHQQDELAESPVEEAYLREVCLRHNPSFCDLAPLTKTEQRLLLNSILPLEPSLAEAMEQRTAGNPYFAMQWIENWVSQGLLEAREDGFVLNTEQSFAWPVSLQDIWREKLQKLLQTQPLEVQIALELAAALGRVVHQSEWEHVCSLSWLKIPHDFLETLVSHRLVQFEERHSFSSWSFAHEMLRQTLEHLAWEADRYKKHHLVCAEMLSDTNHADSAQRRAHHLRQAQCSEEALEPLRQAIQQRIDEGYPRLAESLLTELREILSELYPHRKHRLWIEAHLFRAHIARRQNHLKIAEDALKLAEPSARRNNWEDLLIRSLLEKAMLVLVQGHGDLGLKTLQEAEDRSLRLGHISLQAEVSLAFSEIMTRMGRLDEALDSARLSRSCFLLVGDELGEGKSTFIQAFIARQRGDWHEVPGLMQQALKLFEKTGAQRNIANCMNLHGDYLRKKGEYAKAEELYRESLRRLQLLELHSSAIIELNLSMTLLKQQKYEESREMCEILLAMIADQGPPILIAAGWLILMPTLAVQRDWETWDQLAEKLKSFFARSSDRDVDFAEMAQLAADLAVYEDEIDRAIPMYLLAQEQWLGLQQPDKAAEVQQRIDSLAQDAFFTLAVPGQRNS